MAESAFLDYIKRFGGANQKKSQIFHVLAKQLDEEHIEISSLELKSESGRTDGYHGMKIVVKNGPTFIFLFGDGYIQIGHISPTLLVTRYRQRVQVHNIMENLKELIPISPIGDVSWPNLSDDVGLEFDLFG